MKFRSDEYGMSLSKRLRALAVTFSVAATAALVAPGTALAQAYPNKPIKLIIPFGAGGITDVAGRVVAQHLGEELSQQIVIENRPGAGGSIAAQALSQAASDGYTLLLGTVGTQVVNKMLYSKLNYDPATLTPISLVSNSPYVLATGKIDGVTDMKSLVAHAKANPGKLNFGSAGNGSSPHLALELFKMSTGTEIVHVPFKSGAEAVNAALGGQVQMVIDAIPVILPHAKAGKLHIVSIADGKRNANIAQVPTTTEQGLPAFKIGSWNALVAPPATPAAQVEVIGSALARAMKRPALQARLSELGIEPLESGLPAYQAHVRSETEKWAQVIKTAGTKLD